MVLLTMLGCASVPFGTWMFERTLTLATGDECATTVSHNYLNAYVPEEAAADPAWTSETSNESSPEVFFGRVEGTDDGGAVLIIGSEALIGAPGGDGSSWSFSWDATENSSDSDTHAAGYAYSATVEARASLHVGGTFSGDSFSGTWDEESESTAKYNEYDTWSSEVVAYIGETGQTPVGSYLYVNDAYGTPAAATNTYAGYECDAGGCALTVQSACGYTYEMTGVLTEFSSDDNRWVEDAGQPSGIP